MIQRSQHWLLHFSFRFFAYLSDRTNGNPLFVHPKMIIGSLILSLGLTHPETVIAQKYSSDDETPPKQTAFKDSAKEEEIMEPFCYIVEHMPEFQGGTEVMFEFLSKNIVYPTIAIKDKIEGMVICTFSVNKDGSIYDIKVVRGIHPLLDTEAIRVIKAMPKWSPGKQGGKPVAMKFTLPIRFSLPKKTK